MHGVNIQSIKFLRKRLSFLEAGGTSRNCFKGLEVVGEKYSLLAWNTNYHSLSEFFLHLTVQLGCTLWETAGSQPGLEQPGLIQHGECVGTASLCLVA